MSRKKNFYGQRLCGKVLSDQNLQYAVFDQADIRSVNFSRSNLRCASFKGARAGIAPLWFCILIVCLIILAAFASLVTSYTSALAIVPQDENSVSAILESGFPLVFSLIILVTIIRQGIGASLALWGVIFVTSIIVLAAAVQYSPGSVAEYIIGQVAVRSIGLAGVITGVFVSGIAVACNLVIASQKLLFVLGIIALPVAFWGLHEGIGEKVNLVDWPLAVFFFFTILVTSVLVGFRAVQGDNRFRLIHSVAIKFATFKGTRFNNADLSDADFTKASLENTDFRLSILTRTRWFQSTGLKKSLVSNTYLENPSTRRLLVSCQGQGQYFDYQNLRDLNLKDANLADASFIGADLSNTSLQNADLSRAKLAKTQLYGVQLNQACLTGANIQDWAISLDTQFDQVECDYVYMHLPTRDNQDPYRKPDNRNEFFKPGDFADFIAPIIKILDLYRQQDVDLREVAATYKTIDLFHHGGIDPSAAAIALKRLAELHPDAGIEVVALEGRGNDKMRLQARVSNQADPSELNKDYFEQYREIKELAYGDLQALLRGIEEKDSRIRSLENIVTTAIQQKTFYVETYQNMGDTVADKRSIEFSAGGDISGISGIVGGDVSGVVNVGTISGSVTNTINKLPDDDAEKGELKTLLQQLQAAIEEEASLEPDDKAEALEQVQTLAEAGQKPEDGAMQKAAKTAVKILKGTTAGLSETAKLVDTCSTLLPAISGLLLLL